MPLHSLVIFDKSP